MVLAWAILACDAQFAGIYATPMTHSSVDSRTRRRLPISGWAAYGRRNDADAAGIVDRQ